MASKLFSFLLLFGILMPITANNQREGGQFPPGTNFIISIKLLDCKHRLIAKNPCFEFHNTNKPMIKSFNYQQYREIFMDNGKKIDVPSLAALNITYNNNGVNPCYIIIMPEDQVISLETSSFPDNYSQSQGRIVWANETTIYLPINEEIITLYGFLKISDDINYNGVVGWYFGNQKNSSFKDLQSTYQVKDCSGQYIWSKIDKPREELTRVSVSFGYAFNSDSLSVNRGIPYKLEQKISEIDECESAKENNLSLCKIGAECHDLVYGFYCAWTTINDTGFPYQALEGEYDPSWFVPDNVRNCSKCRDKENNLYFCPKEEYLDEPMNKLDKLIEEEYTEKEFKKKLDEILQKLEELMMKKSIEETKTTLTEILKRFDKIKKNRNVNSMILEEKLAVSVEQNALILAKEFAKANKTVENFLFKSYDGEVQINKFEASTTNFTLSASGREKESITLEKHLNSQNKAVGVVFQYINNTLAWKLHEVKHVKTNLISSIIAATITDPIKITVEFRLKHSALDKTSKRVCGFKNHSSESNWQTLGCKVLDNSQTTSTLCQCHHLTYFAILIDWTAKTTTLSPETESTLSLLSMVGCIICILFLILFLFVVLHVLRFSNENKSFKFVYVSLCLSLLMGNFVFVIGIRMTKYPVLCAIIAGLMEYFFLAAFFWKLIYGCLACHSALKTKELLLNKKMKIICCICGFLIPAIIVVVSAGVKTKDYGNQYSCWLSSGSVSQYFFIGFIVFVIATNAVNIIIIFVVLLRSYLFSFQSQYKGKYHFIFLAQASLCMGFTWLTGFFMFNETSRLAFSILFSLANAMQGVMIFVTLVIFPMRSRTSLHGYVSNLFTSDTSGSDSIKPAAMHLINFDKKRRYQFSHETPTGKELNDNVPDNIPCQQQIHVHTPLNRKTTTNLDDNDNDEDDCESAATSSKTVEVNKISNKKKRKKSSASQQMKWIVSPAYESVSLQVIHSPSTTKE